MFPEAECGRGGRLLTWPLAWLLAWFWPTIPTCCEGFSDRPEAVMSDSRCWLPWLLGGWRTEGWRGCFKDCFLCPRGERWASLWCWRMWFWLLNSGCWSILLGFLFDWMMAGVGSVLTNPFPGVWKFPLDHLAPAKTQKYNGQCLISSTSKSQLTIHLASWKSVVIFPFLNHPCFFMVN